MNQLTNKNILVTGGTGFVGSHLVEELVKLGNNVTTTYLHLQPESYFFSQGLDKKVAMAPVDISDFNAVHDLISKKDIDYIFHLAAQAIVHTAYHNPRRTFESNIMGTVNVLDSARQLGTVKGIVVASSDKAYGKKAEKFAPYYETDPLIGDHPYEASKSATDLVTYTYFKTYDLPVITTRFGNIYGEGDMNFSRIIPGAMESLVNNTTLELRSDGTFFRDYLYVKDVVNGYVGLAMKAEQLAGEAYNFGTDENVSVLDLLGIIEDAVDKKIDYTILNTAKNEIPFQSLDYTKVNKTIGWSPQYTLNSTMQGILQWYTQYFAHKMA